jgi:hypothetical protein
MPSQLMTHHTCKQVIIQTYANRPDLRDQQHLKSEAEWLTDGSNFVLNLGKRQGMQW